MNDNYKISESDVLFEDDGFFSDVPLSGSLSRSMLALNKYVKKNLLYDDDIQLEDDGAYFSKESSPNDSVTKYDSDSVRSNESSERNENLPNETNAEFKYTSVFTVKAVSEPVADVINITEQTDDYKSMLLRDSSDDSRTTISTVYIQYANNTDRRGSEPTSITVPVDNLTINGNPSDQNETKEVILREKFNDLTSKTNRHTLHEFSEWGNRTNIYPDVYAPLPYSEYTFIYFKTF